MRGEGRGLAARAAACTRQSVPAGGPAAARLTPARRPCRAAPPPQVGGYAGLLIAVPTIMYEIIAYVVPGLTKSERQFLGPVIFGSSILFYVGCASGACWAIGSLGGSKGREARGPCPVRRCAAAGLGRTLRAAATPPSCARRDICKCKKAPARPWTGPCRCLAPVPAGVAASSACCKVPRLARCPLRLRAAPGRAQASLGGTAAASALPSSAPPQPYQHSNASILHRPPA